MQRTGVVSSDRLPILITAGVFVVMAACVPLVLRLDDAIDADRAMYHDMESMLGLQNAYIATGEPPIEVDLADGESVMIGERKFTVSPGVALTLRATDGDAFCIIASTDEGAASQRCTD